MGLYVSHDCWSGAYSAFMRWRKKLAEAAGLPPLELMDGFFEPTATLYFGQRGDSDIWETKRKELEARLPIRWECLAPSALYELLYHSDCDGEIAAGRCGPIADALEKLIPLLPDEDGGGHVGNWRVTTRAFVDGLRRAAAAGEPVRFG